MEASTGIIDYHLQGTEKCKKSITGSNVASLTPWLPKKWAGRPTMD